MTSALGFRCTGSARTPTSRIWSAFSPRRRRATSPAPTWSWTGAWPRSDRSVPRSDQLAHSLTLALLIVRRLHVDITSRRTTGHAVVPGDPGRQADARLPLRHRIPRLRRRVDRRRGVAHHPRGPALLGAEPAVGAQWLSAHVRRIHVARRTGRRSARAAARAGQRHRGV